MTTFGTKSYAQIIYQNNDQPKLDKSILNRINLDRQLILALAQFQFANEQYINLKKIVAASYKLQDGQLLLAQIELYAAENARENANGYLKYIRDFYKS
jgi:hypothetical protein